LPGTTPKEFVDTLTAKSATLSLGNYIVDSLDFNFNAFLIARLFLLILRFAAFVFGLGL
jgi:hypothetical protein